MEIELIDRIARSSAVNRNAIFMVILQRIWFRMCKRERCSFFELQLSGSYTRPHISTFLQLAYLLFPLGSLLIYSTYRPSPNDPICSPLPWCIFHPPLLPSTLPIVRYHGRNLAPVRDQNNLVLHFLTLDWRGNTRCQPDQLYPWWLWVLGKGTLSSSTSAL